MLWDLFLISGWCSTLIVLLSVIHMANLKFFKKNLIFQSNNLVLVHFVFRLISFKISFHCQFFMSFFAYIGSQFKIFYYRTICNSVQNFMSQTDFLNDSGLLNLIELIICSSHVTLKFVKIVIKRCMILVHQCDYFC